METHKMMKGVKVGNIGPKMGFNDKDNGWMTLDSVRIPRQNMLMRFINVEKDGSVSIQGDLRMLYSIMLKTRNIIVLGTKHML
jgi:acyl-CoA oxidase